MIISHKYKFICLNPPKTGSETREVMFNEFSDINVHKFLDLKLWKECPSIRHLNYKQMINFCKIFKIEYEKYFIFTFVRNPWERIESWYNMKSKQDSIWKLNYSSFFRFINTHIDESRWQDNYINNELNYIGSLENIKEDIDYLFNYLKIKEKKIQVHKNKSVELGKVNIKKLWTDDLINFVKEKEKNTIKLKKYAYIS